MRTAGLALSVLLALLLFASNAAAQDASANAGDKKDKPKVPALHGQVVRVDGSNLIVRVRGKKGEEPREVTVATNDRTLVRIDGSDASLAELKEGMRVVVPAYDANAPVRRINATTPKAAGDAADEGAGSHPKKGKADDGGEKPKKDKEQKDN